jgi:hypothetical protein
LEVHVLIGITCLTHNWVPHNQHKIGITQAMRNPLDLPLALCLERHKNLSESPQSEPKTITFLHSMILATPSHLGGGNHCWYLLMHIE